MDYLPGSEAPEDSVYEELDMFGDGTGRLKADDWQVKDGAGGW